MDPQALSAMLPDSMGWCGLIQSTLDLATAADQLPKNAHIDYQTLTPIYGPDDIAKNKHQLNMTDIPNAILQMAFNKICIPLTMLTTPALSKVQ